MTNKYLLGVCALAALWAPSLNACMFCDEAAVRTLLFVVTFLGLFCAGMVFFALAYSRKGANPASAAMRVLEAEGITFEGEVKHV
ncbi:hypothetical protein BAC2_00691 [uncultured bacterium]|nr:hypothetical protein BAC2_00691 [uncultured bacterium]